MAVAWLAQYPLEAHDLHSVIFPQGQTFEPISCKCHVTKCFNTAGKLHYGNTHLLMAPQE